MADQRYSATFSFGYNGQTLDTGQVVTLAGLPNDARLVEHRYLVPLAPKAKTCQCGVCGAEFAEHWHRTDHGDKRHPETQLDAREAADLIRSRADRHHPDIQRPEPA